MMRKSIRQLLSAGIGWPHLSDQQEAAATVEEVLRGVLLRVEDRRPTISITVDRWKCFRWCFQGDLGVTLRRRQIYETAGRGSCDFWLFGRTVGSGFMIDTPSCLISTRHQGVELIEYMPLILEDIYIRRGVLWRLFLIASFSSYLLFHMVSPLYCFKTESSSSHTAFTLEELASTMHTKPLTCKNFGKVTN